MNVSFNNVVLFIKRAEEYQTKEFIIEAFASNNIGKVLDVKFIKKHNDVGKSYNGVIVIFERWNMNKLVQTLFSEMAVSKDGTTKFYFSKYRYWIINVHKQKIPECDEIAIVNSSLPDKERINKLEELVKSMSAQIYYMQNKEEKTERLMMDYEHKDTYHHIVNVELHSQIDEKDWEKKWTEEDLKEDVQKLREENDVLRCRLASIAIDMTKKEIQCKQLQEELRDSSCIIAYIENQSH